MCRIERVCVDRSLQRPRRSDEPALVDAPTALRRPQRRAPRLPDGGVVRRSARPAVSVLDAPVDAAGDAQSPSAPSSIRV